MTGIAASAPRIPALRTLVPWTIALALCGHLALTALFPRQVAETGSGGGGKVLGTLSIALGGVPAPAPAAEMPVQPDVVEPAPVVERKSARKQVQPVKAVPKPPQRNIPKSPPVVTRKVQPPKLAQPAKSPAPQLRAAAPADSVAQVATPTLGDGASSKTAGDGGAATPNGQMHDAYLAMLRMRIEKYRTYPNAARRAGNEGIVRVHITIGSDGTLTRTHIVESSGHFALDRAAKRMVQRAAPFPAPPQTTYQVILPVSFSLSG